MFIHDSIPVIDFQYLRRPETLRLDWSDPWYSAFANSDLKRHHDAPLMTFLYIEPYEVRFEMLMRLKELASWMQLDVPDQEADRSRRAGKAARADRPFRGAQQSQVRIDGSNVSPAARTAWNSSGCQPQGIRSSRGLAATDPADRSGWRYSCLRYDRPRHRKSRRIGRTSTNGSRRYRATVIDPVSRLPYDVTRAEPTLRWTNLLDDYNYLGRHHRRHRRTGPGTGWSFRSPGVPAVPGGGAR